MGKKMGRPKLPPGEALTQAERARLYRSKHKNKLKIKEYESKVRAPRNRLARLEENNQVLNNNLTSKLPKAGDENKAVTKSNKKSNGNDRVNSAKESLTVKFKWNRRTSTSDEPMSARSPTKDRETSAGRGKRRTLSAGIGKESPQVLEDIDIRGDSCSSSSTTKTQSRSSVQTQSGLLGSFSFRSSSNICDDVDLESSGSTDNFVNEMGRRKSRRGEIGDSDSSIIKPNLCDIKKPRKKAKLPQGKSHQSVVGEKIRRQNQKEQKLLIESLRENVKVLEREKNAAVMRASISENKLSSKNNYVEKIKEDRKTDNDWLKPVYRSLPSDSKRDFRMAILNCKENFPPGTLSRLRESTGVNFSQLPVPKDLKLSGLAKKVEEFSLLNSSEIPDMKSNKSIFANSSTPNKRFANHHLTVLHSQFEIDNPDLPISYSQFSTYWPSYIIKPKAGDFTSCHCQICDNAGSKFAALLKAGLVDESLEVFAAIKLAEEGDDGVWNNLMDKLEEIKIGESKDKQIIFSQWEKVQKEVGEDESGFNKEKGRKGKKTIDKKLLKTTRVGVFSGKCQADFPHLKDHLHRSKIIKTEIAKEKALIFDDTSGKSALVWVDWSESLDLHQPHEVQSAWFGCQSISLQSGYIFHNSRSRGFGSFSDCKDHKAEAIWASMRPILEELVEQGISRIVFVSDSPINQYRCNKNVWFLQQFTMAYGLEVTWYFTEVSHGKSSADGIGGSLKKSIKELQLFNSSLPVNSINDLMELLQNQTSILLTTFTKDDIAIEKEKLPAKLKALTGALSIHMIRINKAGLVEAKKLPTDPCFSKVNISISTVSMGIANAAQRLRAPAVEIVEEG